MSYSAVHILLMLRWYDRKGRGLASQKINLQRLAQAFLISGPVLSARIRNDGTNDTSIPFEF